MQTTFCPRSNSVRLKEHLAGTVRGAGGPGRVFHADLLAPASAPTAQLWQQHVQPVLDEVLQGVNAAVMAYGQTGSGKTYTMFGTSAGSPQGCVRPSSFSSSRVHDALRRRAERPWPWRALSAARLLASQVAERDDRAVAGVPLPLPGGARTAARGAPVHAGAVQRAAARPAGRHGGVGAAAAAAAGGRPEHRHPRAGPHGCVGGSQARRKR